MGKHVKWADYDEMLGTMSDGQLAKIIGCSSPTVKRRRDKLNIPPFPRDVEWNKYDHLFQTKGDREIRQIIGCCLWKVFERRVILNKRNLDKENQEVEDCSEEEPLIFYYHLYGIRI